MTFLVSQKVVRLLLAVSVSIWLAGGCLLGCGSMATAAPRGADQAAVEAEAVRAPRNTTAVPKQDLLKKARSIRN